MSFFGAGGLGLGQNVAVQAVEEYFISAEITPGKGRACCGSCGKKIGAGSVRVQYGAKFYHLRCHKPQYRGKYKVGENYFFQRGSAEDWSEENKQKLVDWIAKWNEKNEANKIGKFSYLCSCYLFH